MKRVLYLLFLGTVLAVVFRSYCFEVIYVASASMEPTLKTKQKLIVNKLAYLFKKPGRGDIVLLEAPYLDKDMIKRLVGLPGEEFSIEVGQVYINGEPYEEEYAVFKWPDKVFMCDDIEEFRIQQDNYFVMGDNRDLSRDSRDWLEEEGLQMSTVRSGSIKGKILTF